MRLRSHRGDIRAHVVGVTESAPRKRIARVLLLLARLPLVAPPPWKPPALPEPDAETANTGEQFDHAARRASQRPAAFFFNAISLVRRAEMQRAAKMGQCSRPARTRQREEGGHVPTAFIERGNGTRTRDPQLGS